MKNVALRVAGALGVLLIVAVAFAFGGLIGFGEGYAFQLGHSAPTDAWRIVEVLEAIRSGDSPAAISSLEVVLDARAIELNAAQQSAPYRFAWWVAPDLDNESISKMMLRVANYRQQHPSDNQSVQDFLLSKYAPGGDDQGK